MDGAERIAKLMDFPVFYCELKKQRRGYCRVEFDLITETPKETADGEITELFARRLNRPFAGNRLIGSGRISAGN